MGTERTSDALADRHAPVALCEIPAVWITPKRQSRTSG
jgi:hypothetical protein